MKRLLIVLACILAGSVAHADSVVYGYCDDSVGDGVGTGQNKAISCAIYVPASNLVPYRGCTITRIEVGLSSPVIGLAPIICEDSDRNLVEQSGKSGMAGWNMIVLDKPFVIGDKGLYVGYKCVGTYCSALSGVWSRHGNHVSLGGAWEDYGDQGWGAFCIRFHIEGQDLPMDISLAGSEGIECGKGEEVQLDAILGNLSPEAVSTLGVALTIDGKRTDTRQLDVQVPKGRVVSIPVSVTAPSQSGSHQLGVEVLTVNGKADAIPSNSSFSVPMNVYDKTFARRVVFEEGTGTWCGWCVRGYEGMKRMAQKYPEDFIGIGIHYDDEMAGAVDYNPIFNLLGGSFPSCIVNRNARYCIDPNFSDMEYVHLKLRNKVPVRIDARMFVADADTSKVTIRTQTEFGGATDVSYRIAYVVLENGVGPYIQANYYAGGSTPMGGFEKMGNYVSLEFNDVARGIYGGFKGLSGSVPDDIKVGQVYTGDYSITLPRSVARKSNVQVVALLISQATGEIVNAAKCKTFEACSLEEDGIAEVVPAQDVPMGVYDVNGLRRASMQRGLNILRMSDGSVRKVMRR